MSDKVSTAHTSRKAIVYVRQSTPSQVLHHREGQALQYRMQQRLRELGWREIEVIDEDLGKSASGLRPRAGFERLVAEVSLGRVGAVAAHEVSRFARNSRDWHQLVEICRLVDTLLIDQECIYHPRLGNDRLLLGVKGSVSEYELDLLRQRASEARWAKAHRGELLVQAPTGFIKTDDRRLEKHPDRRVQHAIALVFRKFLELGSARQVLCWLRDQALSLPVGRPTERGWELRWRPPSFHLIVKLLRDPTYGGAYAYGKSVTTTVLEAGRPASRRLRRGNWQHLPVLIPDHHEGYVSWQDFLRIQRMLDHNRSRPAGASPGAAKRGPGLLAGLLRCRRCGHKLFVQYPGRKARPRYECTRARHEGLPRCMGFTASPLDRAVMRELWRAIEPGAVEAAHRSHEQHEERGHERRRSIELELQGAEYEAARAQRQFEAVDPENRLVAAELETRWNAALEHGMEVRQRLEALAATSLPETDMPLDPRVLASDLERLWHHPQADVACRKRIVRTLVEEIVVDLDAEANQVVLILHWKGGVHSALRIPRLRPGQKSSDTPSDLVDAVRVLARVCTDDVIAAALNRQGVTTAHGHRWTRVAVCALRNKREIPVYDPDTRRKQGWMNLGAAAAYLRVTPKTLRHAARQGQLRFDQPLSRGPWALERSELDAYQRRRARHSAPGDHTHRQLNLMDSATYRGDAV